MSLPPPGPDGRFENERTGLPARLPSRLLAPLHWLGARPNLLMAAAGVAIVGFAMFMPQPAPERGPSLRDTGGQVATMPMPAPASELPFDPLASEAALLAAASEAAGLATEPALPLPPPPPSAVLAAEADAVYAAADAPPPVAASGTPARRNSGAVLIFDAGSGDVAQADDAAPEVPVVSSAPRRALAPRPAAAAGARGTLTQGTLIPAVLESAIDSARPGGVRALVSADVRSADGRRLLVPRSSRLVGQYRGDPGKPRAFVVWTRIERPDGSRVPLGSLGAGGFQQSYAASPLVSQVGGAEGGGAVRVRPGEPIRVVASRNVDVTEVRR